MRRSGLGRGLDALIPQESTSSGRTVDAALLEVSVDALSPNPHQPRQHFDEEALTGLVESIRELGVLQPVLVRPTGDGTYELIAGERRWRAAQRAGLTAIPAIVREVEELGSVEQALVENVHREDLNPLEEAAAYQQLTDDFGLTHDEVARRVGRSRATVTNALRLFQLPPTIQRHITEGTLTAGHARALLGTSDRAFQEALARKAVGEGWSVRAVEEAVRARAGGGRASATDDQRPPVPEPTRRLRPPGLLELEELLSTYLDTRVAVRMGAKRGQVVIDFASLEDLERIYRRVTDTA